MGLHGIGFLWAVLLVLIPMRHALCSTWRTDQPLLMDEDIGVYHSILVGKIPAHLFHLFGVSPRNPATSAVVTLHAFVTGSFPTNSSTHLRGYFFAESSANVEMNAWGHPSHSRDVKRWNFPVVFKDYETGQVAEAHIETTELWSGKDEYLGSHCPVPFTASFPNIRATHLQILVKDWLQTGEIHLKEQPSAFDNFVRASQAASGWGAWSVLAPFRNHHKTPAFLSILYHHVAYHTGSIGFNGVVLYAPTFLSDLILQDPHLSAFVQDQKLLIIQWKHFNSYQEVSSHPRSRQRYYANPDQIIINNHALLTFSSFENTVVLSADIDEYFVPVKGIRTVQALVASEDCLEPEDSGRPWVTMSLAAPEVLSSGLRRPPGLICSYEKPCVEASDHDLWRATRHVSECSPLLTYSMALATTSKYGKTLLKPTQGRIHAWHVHTGMVDPRYSQRRAKSTCAVVIHATNLFVGRRTPGLFTRHLDLGWDRLLPTKNESKAYAEQCIEDESVRQIFDESFATPSFATP